MVATRRLDQIFRSGFVQIKSVSKHRIAGKATVAGEKSTKLKLPQRTKYSGLLLAHSLAVSGNMRGSLASELTQLFQSAPSFGRDSRGARTNIRARSCESVFSNISIVSPQVRFDGLKKNTDLMAGVMRSLIEPKFWARFISASPEKATQFLNEPQLMHGSCTSGWRTLTHPDTNRFEMPLIQGKRVTVAPSGCRNL